jgi:hypothetical protein
MRLNGSVLIVVLGLLAVLAVIGVAFVTMSSIESNSAANFALQAQFDLAADGAVDYVTQALIRDVWEFGTNSDSPDTATYRQYTGYYLTGKFGTWPWDWPNPVKPTTSLEMGVESPITPWPDAFLATNWSTTTGPPTGVTPAYSFRTGITLAASQQPYNLTTWGGFYNGDTNGNTPYQGDATTDGSPNNLGIPGGTGAVPPATGVSWYDPPNGFWLPELASPFQAGVIRVSVTVQDHAAMVNLNAHGTLPATSSSGSWAYKKAAGKGYFVCDLLPASATFVTIDNLLVNSGTPPGRWSASTSTAPNAPGNLRLGEIFFQNPAIAQDRPFTLDDELELRRLTGTYAQSRLEKISAAGGSTALDSEPGGSTKATNPTRVNSRLGLTTVGWTAQVVPGCSGSGTGATPKCDLNLAWEQGGTGTLGLNTLDFGGVWNSRTTYANRNKQFIANILAFKERRVQTDTSKNYFQLQPYTAMPLGARRQVIMTKVKVDKRQTNTPSQGKDTIKVTVQLYAPWKGNYAGDTSNSMDVTNHRIVISGGSGKTYDLKDDGNITSIAGGGTTAWYTSPAISVSGSTGFKISKIALEADTASGSVVIDQIKDTDISYSDIAVTKRRPVGVWPEPRATDDTDPSCVGTVVYVKNWTTGTDASWGTLEGGIYGVPSGGGVPIRFPHSVPYYSNTDPDNKWVTTTDGPLPPYYNPADTSVTGVKRGIFKAFLRVGDLNQVLCPATEDDATSYWPWIYKVGVQSSAITSTSGLPSAADIAAEAAVKWDWWPAAESAPIDRKAVVYDSTNNPPIKTQYRRFNAANIFCVDSPWADSFDNDGDGFKDADDTGVDKEHGRFCGKEIRVAGRINLNTATDQALRALGLSLTGSENTFIYLLREAQATGGRPLCSPVEVLRKLTTANANAECKGPLEKRDFWYTRISNIATTRSDTFSIYGTVQYVIPPGWNQIATTSLTGDGSMKIVRTRRFWALVDRSPCFSYAPTSTANFVRPRIMNFQWMD